VNTATPPRNAARFPTRAPAISNAAYTSEYNAATQARLVPDACIDTRITGSITFTTAALYIDSSNPRHTTVSTAPELGWRRSPAPRRRRSPLPGSPRSRSGRSSPVISPMPGAFIMLV
jgi:hypothetical protein